MSYGVIKESNNIFLYIFDEILIINPPSEWMNEWMNEYIFF